MIVYGSDSCGMRRSSAFTFSASSGMQAAMAVGSGGGPSVSGMALMQLKTATTVSMMLNSGTKGVSAGWITSIRLMCSIVTPPGSVIWSGSGISGISMQMGSGTSSS